MSKRSPAGVRRPSDPDSVRGPDVEGFARAVRAAESRLTSLRQGGLEGRESREPSALDALYLELSAAMEALRGAEEELRQQNEALAVSRELVEVERRRYQELFDFAPDAYLITDGDG